MAKRSWKYRTVASENTGECQKQDNHLLAMHIGNKQAGKALLLTCRSQRLDLTCLLRLCRLRDLNDEINKVIREKGHWERRIVELGGPDYAKSAPKVTDADGKEITDSRGMGYRYFGAAKNLPGRWTAHMVGFVKQGCCWAGKRVHFHAVCWPHPTSSRPCFETAGKQRHARKKHNSYFLHALSQP